MAFFQAVKDFFAEFSGIAGKWYIEVENTNYAPDFKFILFPYPAAYKTDVRDSVIDLITNELLSHEMMHVTIKK